jgi:hypothetical protein
MSQDVKPRVVPVEEAAIRLLAGREPATTDPFVPTPNRTRKKSMSVAEMERIAEDMARQPESPEGDKPAVRPEMTKFALVEGATAGNPPASPSAPPAPSERDILARYGLTQETAAAVGRFLSTRTRLSIELKDGSVHIPVISVLQSTYSITIVTPLKLNEMTFVPRPGTEVRLQGDNGLNATAYYPGAYAEIPGLGIAIMTFIRQEDTHGKA